MYKEPIAEAILDLTFSGVGGRKSQDVLSQNLSPEFRGKDIPAPDCLYQRVLSKQRVSGIGGAVGCIHQMGKTL